MPKAPSQRGLSAQQTGGVPADTPSGSLCSPAPPRGRLCAMPETLSPPLKAVPLGKVASPQAMTEGVTSAQAHFALQPETFPPCQGLPLRGSWHRVAMTERVCRPLGEGGCDQQEQTEGVISTFPPSKVKNPAEKRSRWFKKQFGCVILEAKVPAGRGNRRA